MSKTKTVYCPACRGHGTDVHEFPCPESIEVRDIYQIQKICGHCGKEALGFATFNNVRVCHHEMRDCYRMITVYGATLGHPSTIL